MAGQRLDQDSAPPPIGGAMTDAERDAVLQLWAQQQRDEEGVLDGTTTRDVAEALRIPEDQVRRMLEKVRVEQQAAGRAEQLRTLRRRQQRGRRLAVAMAVGLLLISFAFTVWLRASRAEAAELPATATLGGGARTQPLGFATSTTGESFGTNVPMDVRLPRGSSARLGEHAIEGASYVRAKASGLPTREAARSVIDDLVDRVVRETRLVGREGEVRMEDVNHNLAPGREQDSELLSWEDLSLSGPNGRILTKLPFSRSRDPLIQDAARKERRRRIESAIDQFTQRPH